MCWTKCERKKRAYSSQISRERERDERREHAQSVTIMAPESFNVSFAERDIACVFSILWGRNACRNADVGALLILPFFHFFSYAIFFVLFFLVEPLRKKLHSVSHILSFRLSRVVVVALIKPLSPFERRRRTVWSIVRFFCVLWLVKRYKREKRIVITRSFPIL